MVFPTTRLRRLRSSEAIRSMIAETSLSPKEFIMPYFVVEGNRIKREIPSLPGQFHLSIDQLIKEAKEVKSLGIPAIILFGVPSKKDPEGKGAYSPNGIIQSACRALKEKVSDLIVITDLCLCEYREDGHCGVVKDGVVDNDETLKLLSEIAVSQAEAGADIVAPSDMMDGRVSAIRSALDSAGFSDRLILSYSAKYASSFYSPFREAAKSTPLFFDRKSYQMDWRNSDEAMREIAQDIEEGADIVMVKPALSYLDIIFRAKSEFNIPIAAFSVSGEYAMVKSASNLLDEKGVVNEILTSIKRAGADIIITYFAKEFVSGL
jgi:porphobilinogen synthase